MPGIVERRKHKRINTQLNVSFYCNETDYDGVITNISEGGMFIRTGKLSFPLESELNIFLRTREKILTIPVKVRWLSKSMDIFDGMGVEVKDHIPEYIAFVNSLRNE
jgi:c-di-GMP-binding flagellar brake protein YcgR